MTAVTTRQCGLSMAMVPPRLMGASSGCGEMTSTLRPGGTVCASMMKRPEWKPLMRSLRSIRDSAPPSAISVTFSCRWRTEMGIAGSKLPSMSLCTISARLRPAASSMIREAVRRSARPREKASLSAPPLPVGDGDDPRPGFQVRPRHVEPDMPAGIHGKQRDVDARHGKPVGNTGHLILMVVRWVERNDVLRRNGQRPEQALFQHGPERRGGPHELVEDDEADAGEVHQLGPRALHEEPVGAEGGGARKDGHDEVGLVLHRGKEESDELLLHVLIVARRDDVHGGHRSARPCACEGDDEADAGKHQRKVREKDPDNGDAVGHLRAPVPGARSS